MELKLNIYDQGKIEKTYKTREYTLMMGTAEDILNLVDIDQFSKGLESEEAVTEIVKIVVKSFPTFGEMVREIFPDMTDEEYRKTSVKEVATLVIQVIKYTVSELFNASSKN